MRRCQQRRTMALRAVLPFDRGAPLACGGAARTGAEHPGARETGATGLSLPTPLRTPARRSPPALPDPGGLRGLRRGTRRRRFGNAWHTSGPLQNEGPGRRDDAADRAFQRGRNVERVGSKSCKPRAWAHGTRSTREQSAKMGKYPYFDRRAKTVFRCQRLWSVLRIKCLRMTLLCQNDRLRTGQNWP